MMLVDRNCPICFSNQNSILYAESNIDPEKFDGYTFASRKLPDRMHFRMLLCLTCDLIYSSPAPTEENLNRLYREADFDSSSEAKYASASYARNLSRIIKHIPDLNGALDVGTGEGSFLKYLLNSGFTNIEGIEPSEKPIEAAEENIRSLIKKGVFIKENYQPDSLSLITCFQTIEHILNPLQICQDFYSLLKNGGALYLVGHSSRSFSAKILGLRSPIYDVEHMQIFSPKSIKKMLLLAGFKQVIVLKFNNKYPVEYFLKLLPLSQGLKNALLKLLKIIKLSKVQFNLSIGNMAVIAYKK